MRLINGRHVPANLRQILIEIGARLSLKLNVNTPYFGSRLFLFDYNSNKVGYSSNSYMNFDSSIKLVVP